MYVGDARRLHRNNKSFEINIGEFKSGLCTLNFSNSLNFVIFVMATVLQELETVTIKHSAQYFRMSGMQCGLAIVISTVNDLYHY